MCVVFVDMTVSIFVAAPLNISMYKSMWSRPSSENNNLKVQNMSKICNRKLSFSKISQKKKEEKKIYR